MIQGHVNANREALVPLQLRAGDARIVQLDAVVDTGFSDSVALSSALIASLQLPYYGTADYELGDGNVVTFRIYTATVLWNGQESDVPVLACDGGTLIGMRILYGCRLSMDVVDGGSVVIQPYSF